MRRFIMLLEQIQYIGLPEGGFELRVSADVSDRIQQSFLENLVEQHWNRQALPFNYRAVYLYQPSLTDIVFGWLYAEVCDETDDTVPYFIGHYLQTPLKCSLADVIFTFLSQGPVCNADRQQTRQQLQPLSKIPAPNLWNYRPQRTGVSMGEQERSHCFESIGQGECVHIFTSMVEQVAIAELTETKTEQLIEILMQRIGPIARVMVWQAIETTAIIADPHRRTQQLIRKVLEPVDTTEKVACRQEIEQVFYLTEVTPPVRSQPFPEMESESILSRGEEIHSIYE